MLQQDPALLTNLQPQSGLAQVQPNHPVLGQVKGEQKPGRVPCPELKADGKAPRSRRRGPRQLEEAQGAGERYGDGNRFRARKGHVALTEKQAKQGGGAKI